MGPVDERDERGEGLATGCGPILSVPEGIYRSLACSGPHQGWWRREKRTGKTWGRVGFSHSYC